MVVGHPVGRHGLQFANAQAQGLALVGVDVGHGIVGIPLVGVEGLRGSIQVVGILVGVVAVRIATVEVEQRSLGIAQIEPGVLCGGVAGLPGSVGRRDGSGAVECTGREAVDTGRHVGQFLPDVERARELFGSLAGIACIDDIDGGSGAHGRDVGAFPSYVVARERAIGDEERQVGWLAVACQLQLLLLVGLNSLLQLSVAQQFVGCIAALQGACGIVVGACQGFVVGVLVVVLHLAGQYLQVLYVGYAVVHSVVVHGRGLGGYCLHLQRRQRSVEYLQVVEQGVLHDGVAGKGRASDVGGAESGHEVGQAEPGVLGATQLAVDVYAGGIVLLHEGDVVPSPDLQARP